MQGVEREESTKQQVGKAAHRVVMAEHQLGPLFEEIRTEGSQVLAPGANLREALHSPPELPLPHKNPPKALGRKNNPILEDHLLGDAKAALSKHLHGGLQNLFEAEGPERGGGAEGERNVIHMAEGLFLFFRLEGSRPAAAAPAAAFFLHLGALGGGRLLPVMESTG